MASLLLAHSKSIAKESIPDLIFPAEDVLADAEKRKIRKSKIIRAMDYGNQAQCKVNIIFKDNEGLKKVRTTIWGLTPDAIKLKDCIIPTHRVLDLII